MDDKTFNSNDKRCDKLQSYDLSPCLSRAGKNGHRAGVPFNAAARCISDARNKESEYDNDLMCSKNLDMNETTVADSASQPGS